MTTEQDWVKGIPPRIEGAEFLLKLKDGTGRRARRVHTFDPQTLLYTDCVHHLQNIVCDDGEIDSWTISL